MLARLWRESAVESSNHKICTAVEDTPTRCGVASMSVGGRTVVALGRPFGHHKEGPAAKPARKEREMRRIPALIVTCRYCHFRHELPGVRLRTPGLVSCSRCRRAFNLR